MKRTPLLDLGNVVVQVDFHPFLNWLAEKAGHTGTDQVSALLRSSLFYDFEFGHISRAEFGRRLAKLYGVAFSAGDLEERFCAIFPGMVEGIEAAMDELLAQGPIYCLSNTNEIHLQFIRAQFPVMQKFTRVFASHEMGRRKPYPGIYRDVARELNIDPRDLVFFDDVLANVQGARRAGLEAHFFDGVEGLRERMLRREPGASTVLNRAKELDDNDSGGGLGHG